MNIIEEIKKRIDDNNKNSSWVTSNDISLLNDRMFVRQAAIAIVLAGKKTPAIAVGEARMMLDIIRSHEKADLAKLRNDGEGE